MDEDLWQTVAAERLRVADQLEALAPEQWEQPSLCERWRVRDVAAHLAMTPTAPTLPTLLKELAKARGRLWDAAAAIAIAHAALPTDQLVAQLRRDAAARTLPSFTNPENALLDVLVHGQDIAVPLGLSHPVPTRGGVAAFEHAWAMGWPFHAKRRLAGRRLVATDADLSVGDGPVIEGGLAELLLLVTGRTAAAKDRLTGEGLSSLGV